MTRQAPPDGSGRTPVLLDTDAIAARSRSGVWSLGHLRACWIGLGVVTAVLLAVAIPVGGGRAALGVVIGCGIVGAFFTSSAVAIAAVGARAPALILPTALGTYLLKIVVLGVVLSVVPVNGPVDTRWLAGAVGVGLLGWLAVHLRVTWTRKIFYVDPS